MIALTADPASWATLLTQMSSVLIVGWVQLAAMGGMALANYFANRNKNKGADEDEGGPNDPLKLAQQSLSGSATRHRQQADALGGQGQEALSPVIDYFKQLLGGDQASALQATLPERARVIDQYDTARQAISQFGARGGGATAALAGSQVAQASDLSQITANARRGAAQGAAGVGTALEGLAQNAEGQSSNDLSTLIQSILSQRGLAVNVRGQNLQAAEGMGEALGSLLGLYLTRSGAGGAGGGGLGA